MADARSPYAGQVLLLDADDTLWENNIYFERVIARFLDRLGQPTSASAEANSGRTPAGHGELSRAEVRQRLNAIERRMIAQHGYGVRSFSMALAAAYTELASHPPEPEAVAEITQLALAIDEEPIELLPGVRETLAELSRRQRLVLLTKGDEIEQRRKILRSGLAEYFSEARVVAEKNAALYRSLPAALHAPADALWMAGNSPRSDINPALAAGLRAILIPHPQTWVLEHEPLAEAAPGRLLELREFRELLRYF